MKSLYQLFTEEDFKTVHKGAYIPIKWKFSTGRFHCTTCGGRIPKEMEHLGAYKSQIGGGKICPYCLLDLQNIVDEAFQNLPKEVVDQTEYQIALRIF